MEGTIPFEVVCDGYNLYRAWMEVRTGRTAAARQQGAGVDGVTVADWEAGWQQRLRALQRDLLSGAYRPSPLLRFEVPRRRPACLAGVAAGDRSEAGTRTLGIPTVTDRVVQRAVKNLLEPGWEAVFLPCSHGFRPDRSVFTAVAHVLWHEARGLHWVADADIEACFDNIFHDRLLDLLAPAVDDRLLGLIEAWLATGASAPGRGVAQGAVLSPLLANAYLHPFDTALVRSGWALVRYADDWVILCASREEALAALEVAAGVLADLGLALNPQKTAVVPFGPGFRFLGAAFCH
jgi:group II intron reverse transcriptase/maturase